MNYECRELQRTHLIFDLTCQESTSLAGLFGNSEVCDVQLILECEH